MYLAVNIDVFEEEKFLCVDSIYIPLFSEIIQSGLHKFNTAINTDFKKYNRMDKTTCLCFRTRWSAMEAGL